MSDNIYKLIEITGTSKTGVDDAISNAINKASETLHSLRWFEVTDIRGDIDKGSVAHWQVTMKIGLTLDK